MREWQSLSHVKWECKYHVVIVSKYRRKVIFGRTRRQIGQILRQLCRQKGVELVEGNATRDHIHLVLSVPPKYSIAMLIGYLKGKSAIQIHRQQEGIRQRSTKAMPTPCSQHSKTPRSVIWPRTNSWPIPSTVVTRISKLPKKWVLGLLHPPWAPENSLVSLWSISNSPRRTRRPFVPPVIHHRKSRSVKKVV